MNRVIKYALILILGLVICAPVQQEAFAGGTESEMKTALQKAAKKRGKQIWKASKKAGNKGKGSSSTEAALGIAKVIMGSDGVPVIDITSGPAHTVVIAVQEFLRLEFPEETEIKEKIRPRLSVIYEKEKKKGDSEEDSTDEEGETSGKKKRRKIDAKLSKIEIKSNEVTELASGGIVGTGVGNIITTQGQTSMADLVGDQQKKYISSAGTLSTKADYENQRQYDEQEQAVQMIAYAATVRQNVNSIIREMIEKADANYEESDVKKDLDPENDKKKVEETNDYNQVLRQYAYYSLIYDQLLSLEQQIIGLRLQTKGALAEQKSNALSDVVEDIEGTEN